MDERRQKIIEEASFVWGFIDLSENHYRTLDDVWTRSHYVGKCADVRRAMRRLIELMEGSLDSEKSELKALKQQSLFE